MAWTAPRDWVVGEIVTASICNTHIRDNLRYIKGLDGTVVFSDGIDLGANEITVNSVEVVGVDGEVNAAAVEDKFLRNDGNDSTSGNLTVANLITSGNVDGVDVSAHDVATTAVHGVGGSTIESTSGSQTKVNTHGALTTGTHGIDAGRVISGTEYGSYSGTGGTTAREIDIGFRPRLVIIHEPEDTLSEWVIVDGFTGAWRHRYSEDHVVVSGVYISANGFTVCDGVTDANTSGYTHYWVAIS
ncbi:MAG: hypothetical protein SVY53_12110 [Chloroflexota bacterium]|nr:hypothetical protein [Chloroflexota bacterium]